MRLKQKDLTLVLVFFEASKQVNEPVALCLPQPPPVSL